MGKSPGKWLKTILFGKKSSRSDNSKGRNASKATTEKERLVAAKEPSADFPVDPPSVSEPITGSTYGKEESLMAENVVAPEIPSDDQGIVIKSEGADEQGTVASGALDDSERIRQEQAAIKAQAAFRGYLARRAFRALKGIIRLQALVRGYLVRRQAIATLRCLQGIMKFQTLVRVRKFKLSDADPAAHKKQNLRRPMDAMGSPSADTATFIVKLPENTFVCKLFRSSISAIPLRLQYGLEDPNSAWNWLERWTFSCIREPVPQLKKANGLQSQSKQYQGQSKRTNRRTPAANVDNGMPLPPSEIEKPKRNSRKSASQPTEPVLEHPQNELEKVKRSLRKVSNSTLDSSERLEVEPEKPKRILRKATNPQTTDIPGKTTFDSTEKMTKSISAETEKLKDSPTEEPSTLPPHIPDITTCDAAEKMTENNAMGVSKEPVGDIGSTPLESDGPVEVSHNALTPLDLQPSDDITKDESVHMMNGDGISKEFQTNHDNQKTSRRRASLTAAQENVENGLQNSPTVPSYMAATQSAKAKLRAQGSPRVSQGVTEKNDSTRRHSLPSPSNTKLTSMSPRAQKLVQTNGKGHKNDKSPLSCRDGEKVHTGWRR